MRPIAPLAIFDFDGTLADTFGAVIAILDRIAPERGHTQDILPDPDAARRTSIADVVELRGITKSEIPDILARVRREMAVMMDAMPFIAGVVPQLRRLKQAGFDIAILTSNSRPNVLRFLMSHGLSALFDEIHSGVALFDKAHALREIIEKRGGSKSDIVSIGDESRDVLAAREVGVKCVAVSWGFSGRALIEREHPDALIDDPAGLADAVLGAWADGGGRLPRRS